MKYTLGQEPKLSDIRVVHRIKLPLVDRHEVEFPLCSQIVKLAVARDGVGIDLWYERNAESCDSTQTVVFRIYGTGQLVMDGHRYLDTIVMPDDLVWHVYVEAE